MGTWQEVIQEIQTAPNQFDAVRTSYLSDLADYRGRNVIAYYSSFLHKNQMDSSINDLDTQSYMATIHGMDRTKGLDLVLHTPGGGIAATEALVTYLLEMFSGDIEVLVPQIAMSAGTMIACSSRRIYLGKHSSLGPIDPQINGVAAKGVIEEFDRAKREIAEDQGSYLVWKAILEKYPPSFIDACQKAIEWSELTTAKWLSEGMFREVQNADARAKETVEFLSSRHTHFAHERHIGIAEAREAGLIITALEDDQQLQELVVTLHHAYSHTLQQTNAVKIVENQNGVRVVNNVR